jgi:hypothetical protein
VNLEERFAKVVGRPASEAERERLYRIRDALEVHDNDALWTIVMALEHYDSLYRRYPEQLATETTRAIEGARQAFADAATSEAAKVHGVLARQVARTSAELAKKLAERPVGVPWIAAAGAALVVFGAICLSAGVVLGSGARPFWMTRGRTPGGWLGALGMVLGAPAGWMAFALLLPAAGYGAWNGWRLVRAEESESVDRWVGWIMVGASVFGAVGCVVVLAEVL